jgi:hypothetical protein
MQPLYCLRWWRACQTRCPALRHNSTRRVQSTRTRMANDPEPKQERRPTARAQGIWFENGRDREHFGGGPVSNRIEGVGRSGLIESPVSRALGGSLVFRRFFAGEWLQTADR